MCCVSVGVEIFCVKQKTAYEMRISDWSSDVCSSDLADALAELPGDLQHLPDAAVEEGPGGGEALRPVVQPVQQRRGVDAGQQRPLGVEVVVGRAVAGGVPDGIHRAVEGGERTEEHTSELQSLMPIPYAFFFLKQKKHTRINTT